MEQVKLLQSHLQGRILMARSIAQRKSDLLHNILCALLVHSLKWMGKIRYWSYKSTTVTQKLQQPCRVILSRILAHSSKNRHWNFDEILDKDLLSVERPAERSFCRSQAKDRQNANKHCESYQCKLVNMAYSWLVNFAFQQFSPM